MNVKTIQKIFEQKKQVRIFFVDIQCQQLGHFIIQKTKKFYIAEKTV